MKSTPSNKYHAERVGEHASKKEHYRAAQLRMLEQRGIIMSLREQVPYELIPSQYAVVDGKRKCIERSCTYVADFVYTRATTGEQVVEDTKGVRTPEYVIKRKLMLQVHGIRIKEV